MNRYVHEFIDFMMLNKIFEGKFEKNILTDIEQNTTLMAHWIWHYSHNKFYVYS